MFRRRVQGKNLQWVQNRLRVVPNMGTVRQMSKSPLREFLDAAESSAETFAVDKGLSPWSVRHWARGNKVPSLSSQMEIERATGGKVTPAMWLEWSLARQQEAA